MHINMDWGRLWIISMWFWYLIYVGMIRAKLKEFGYEKENMGLLKNYIEKNHVKILENMFRGWRWCNFILVLEFWKIRILPLNSKNNHFGPWYGL